MRFMLLLHTSQEVAEDMFGRTAKELSLKCVQFCEYLYSRRKLNSETFIDRRLSKCTIVNVEALNPSSESHCLVRVIIKLLQGNLGSASVCHTPGTIVGTKTDLSDVEV